LLSLFFARAAFWEGGFEKPGFVARARERERERAGAVRSRERERERAERESFERRF
jgi:hypothetical protein